jgi:RNA polymerase sigma factor (sigma-70 family)
MTALEGQALLDHGKAIARRYARRVGIEVAEELRAEAVLRALASPPPDGRIEPWLERIYRNLLVDRWRRGKTAALHVDVEGIAGARTPEDDLLGHERRRAVRTSLGQLPRETRRALLIRYYGELDDDEAAARLGIATATVRTRIHRALARLRPRLADVRGWFPPLLGKLGIQATTVGLAPVLVAVLVVAGAAPSPPETAPERVLATATVDRPAQRRAGDAFTVGPPDSPAPPPPSPAPRAARRATVTPTGAPASERAPVPVVDVEDPTDRQVLHPDTLAIFAEPERPARPCMVEAPPSLVAQIDKMMDDLL